MINDFEKGQQRFSKIKAIKSLYTTTLSTPLGPMIAIADEQVLYLLEFDGRKGLDREIKQLEQKMMSPIVSGNAKPLEMIELELEQYFAGKLQDFKTPIFMFGTAFQQHVWNELRKIPYGKVCSYSQLAIAVGNPLACRAVARANATNQLAIIIPCHRVIAANGGIGGYGRGIEHKKYLLDLESKSSKNKQFFEL